jgi:hypothetical protein
MASLIDGKTEAKHVASTPPQIKLVPWDSESEEHIIRMIQQRTTCGWKQDAVRSWLPLQKKGDIALYWIVRAPSSH